MNFLSTFLGQPNVIASAAGMITLASITATLAAALFMLTRFQKMKLEARLAERENYAKMSELRREFEYKFYRLNEQMLANAGRWNDVNHVLTAIEKSTYSDQKSQRHNTVSINNNRFLKSLGIEQKDIELDRELVFLLMPFHEYYRTRYLTMRDACNDIGLKCFRGDEYPVDNITREFVKSILKSNFVIALVDGRNANVFFELGIAYAFDKDVIIVSEAPADVPIDLRMKKIVFYKTMDELYHKLKDEIGRTLASSDLSLVSHNN